MKNRISFIIIGKNESKNIAKCIESIKRLNFHNYEIIYIDSNSIDDSENILSQYSEVKSYKIISNRYTAALARDIGVDKSTGENIFFLDGDMEITADTDLYYCLSLLEKEQIAIVSGDLKDIWIKDELVVNKIDKVFDVKHEIEDLKAPGGYFLTKRDEYIRAGRFNKILSCNEEVDLFSRYKKSNKQLIRTKKMCCLHNNRKDNKAKSHLSRLSSGYYADFWRVILNAFKGGYIKEYLNFKSQLIMLRSILVTFIITICIISSIFNWKLVLLPVIYYLLLVCKYKFNVKLLKYNQLNNLMIIMSLIFIFLKNDLEYKVKEINF